MSWRHAYARAMTFAEFVAGAKKNQQLWQDLYRLTVIPPDLRARARALVGRRHLLILVEDWCGDAVNTVPAIVRLAEEAPDVHVRLLTRDANPDVMNAHLTGTSRSIPVVMVLDAAFEECGWWGPRPRELQSWVLSTGLALEKDARYRAIRAWYARDRGRTTLEEVLRLLEPCADRTGGERAAVA
ncbi:MAG: thioredoxin family protein [Gemmatimonadaceae bacterium]|nr:thioredoxin family protein [Gemmatimonadaceae bacterium]